MQTAPRRIRLKALALGAALAATGCVEAPSWFPFEAHLAPRVFVAHHPLLPEPDGSISVSLQPDLAPGDSVIDARAWLIDPDGGSQSETCQPLPLSPSTYSCTFALDGFDDGKRLRYRGELTVQQSGGQTTTVRGDADYEFTVAARDNPSIDLRPVRVPVAPRPKLEGTRFAVSTALVRDPSDGAQSEASFTGSAWDLIFEGILADPVYRWRSNQLAFYYYSEPGFVSDYYSGLDTRCGKNPWPREARLPLLIKDMDAIGVLHRRTEGGGTGPETAGGTFRDCAGQVVKPLFAGLAPPPIATFSTQAGTPVSAEIGTHEFGHALFGLSDEYNETTSSRTAPPNLGATVDVNCCCLASQDGTGPGDATGPGDGGPIGIDIGDIGGGDETLYCLGADGELSIANATTVTGDFAGTTPNCADRPLSDYPAHCGAGPDPGGCPSLLDDCLQAGMWLGADVPDDARDNLFGSEAECEAARNDILVHPGIEDAAEGVLPACTLLCGPGNSVADCACEPDKSYWRLDRSPADAASEQDLMATVTRGTDHGGACARCVETSLCVRWERARGRTAEQTWEYCEQPPENIVELQEGTVSLVDAIIRFFRELFGLART